MKAGGRLALYGAGLVVAFGAAFGVAGATIPDSFVTSWSEGSEMNSHTEGHDGSDQGGSGHTPQGLSISAGGYTLSPVTAPGKTGEDGELSFRILDDTGEPLTDFTTTHEKDLHLITVRSDGSEFTHVHPTLDKNTGIWSAPWNWDQAGTHRIYADFTLGDEGAEGITLSRTVEVEGEYQPVDTAVKTTDEVDGYTVSLEGELAAGMASELDISVARDGEPVTTLEPYLGAFGHLVALRQGDMAYLHVHPEGDEPGAEDTGGPVINFATTAPTVGRYLLYLDFQVNGKVHTAEFVIDATSGAIDGSGDSDNGGHSEGH